MRRFFMLAVILLVPSLAMAQSTGNAGPAAPAYPPSTLELQRAHLAETERRRAGAKKAYRQSRTRQWTGSGTSKPDVDSSDFIGGFQALGTGAVFDSAVAALLLAVLVTALSNETFVNEGGSGGDGGGGGSSAAGAASTSTATSTN